MMRLIRFWLISVLALAFSAAPAFAFNLLTLVITTALTGTAETAVQDVTGNFHGLSIQCNFTYGSSGTTAAVWIQTSLDGGTTWSDIANCAFTTSSLRKIYNLNAGTSVTSIATPTDGSLTSNTSVDGILGPMLRTKVTTTGTYAGGTTLAVDVQRH